MFLCISDALTPECLQLVFLCISDALTPGCLQLVFLMQVEINLDPSGQVEINLLVGLHDVVYAIQPP